MQNGESTIVDMSSKKNVCHENGTSATGDKNNNNKKVASSNELKSQIADLVTQAFDSVMAIDANVANPVEVRGYDFSATPSVDYTQLFDSFRTTGIQATHFALACEQINKMIECKLKPVDLNAPGVTDAARTYPALREQSKANNNSDDEFFQTALQRTNCTIYLGYTSNMISSGVRESIKFLVKHRMVDVLVTTTGGIEEDFMKCMRPALMDDFEYDGVQSRHDGLNRIGNMFVPNDNYRVFEDWLLAIFDRMLEEQKRDGCNWTPSKLIARLGREIDNEDSVYYWAARNNIPVFCPAITDGAIGDCLFYHSMKSPGLRIDLVEDIQRMDLISLFAVNTGAIILGGATPKHHILNSNCMRNGVNYAVFVNTGQPFDASDSGAKPNEAFSWAKIRLDAAPVKIYGEASLIFPLLVAQTFAKNFPRVTF